MIHFLTIILLSVTDHILTYWEINRGIAREANPIVAGIMNMPLQVSLPVRLSWVLLMLTLLWCSSKYKPLLVKRSVIFLTVIYSLIITYHLTVIVR